MLDSFVAVKILDLNQIDAEQAFKRFQNEAELLNTFNHKNIVKFLSFGKSSDGLPFMVLEYLEGKTLSEILEGGVLSPSRAQEIFEQVCQGLTYAHERGVIHRDIKPSNLLVISDGEDTETVKILDFGTFRRDDMSVQQQLTQQGTLIGTPNYMSPEQCRGEKADPRSDIYALGCVMYEAVCGTPPMVAESDYAIMNNHLTTMVTKVRSKSPISQKFEAVLLRCLNKNPSERYQSAAELSTALDAVQPEASFRIPKKAIYVCAGILLLMGGVYTVKRLVQNREHEHKQNIVTTAEKRRFQGLSYYKLPLISPPKTPEDLHKNMETYYQWLKDNHIYLMHHYTKEVPTPDDAPTQIIEAYRTFTEYKRTAGKPNFGKELSKEMEAELLSKISRLSKSQYADNYTFSRERRTIYHFYRVLFALAVCNEEFEKAEKILAEAEASHGSAEAQNDFLCQSYEILSYQYLNRNYNERALQFAGKLNKLVDRIQDRGTRKYRAVINTARCYSKSNKLAEAHKVYEQGALMLLERNDRRGQLETLSNNLTILGELAFQLNQNGLFDYTIKLLSNPNCWADKNSKSDGWIRARTLLAEAYLNAGREGLAKKIFKEILPLAGADLDGAEARITIATDLIGFSLQHDNDADLQKTLLMAWPLINENNMGDFIRILHKGKQRAETDKMDQRFIEASFKLKNDSIRLPFACFLATFGHDLRGRGQTEPAVKLYEQAINEFAKIGPYYHGAIVCYYAQVLCYLNANQLDKIEPILKRAYEQDALRQAPNNEHYLLDHGQIEYWIRKGDNANARKLSAKDIAELLELIETDRKSGKSEKWKVNNLAGRCTNYLTTYDADPDASKLDKELDQLLKRVKSAVDFCGRPGLDDIEYITALSNFYAKAAVVKRKAGNSPAALALFKQAYDLLTDSPDFTDMRLNLKKELGLH